MEILIRIHAGDDGAVEWRANPEKVTFRDTLNVISSTLFPKGPPVRAFEYEDEEGDRITVKSEEEMVNMVAFHVTSLSENGPEFLMIYPKVAKTASKKNIHSLKVQTEPVDQNEVIPMDSSSGGSRKQQPKDIREILADGATINESDLEIGQLLGKGNAGTVHCARHQSSGTLMAVKMIQLDITPDSPEVQKQIMSELQVLYKCRSAVIIAFYGAYFVENRISICTEFMDGGSLDKYKKIIESVLGRMTVSVVSGLRYLWSLKIMHRDVKPSNLLVNTRGQVKLCDFGVSVQLVESMAKTVIGTHAYMAPERILGRGYSVYSDVWSLGVTLFELGIGRFPYESVLNPGIQQKTVDDEQEQIMQIIAEKEATKPSECNNLMPLLNSIVYQDPPQLPKDEFSHEFEDFIQHCIKKDPEMRSLPEALMRHPLIAKYDDGNLTIVADWVCSKLEEMKLEDQKDTEMTTDVS